MTILNQKVYNRIDKIIVNFEEYVTMGNWVRDQKFDSIDIPLQECLIIVKNIERQGINISFALHFKMSDIGIFIDQYDMRDMELMVSILIDEEYFINENIKINTKERYRKSLGEAHLQKLAKASVLLIMDVFQYMTHKPKDVVQTSVSKRIKKPSRNNTSRNKKSNYVKIHSKRYEFDLDHTNESKRDFTRHTEAWTVRGHWRYYKKSGKKVWIDSYKKGKGNIEGKVYKI